VHVAAALTGGVELIVTGDDDLLTLRSYEGIRILSPRRFLQLLEERH
jgi:predicted nucleic acid-binding protein